MTDKKFSLGHAPENIRKPSLVHPLVAGLASLIIPNRKNIVGKEIHHQVKGEDRDQF